MEQATETKTCYVCNTTKALTEFTLRKNKVYRNKCRKCNVVWYRQYVLGNKEKNLAAKKKYRLANKEKIKIKNLKYCLVNREKIKKTQRKYYLVNREKILVRCRKYEENNREKMNETRRKYQRTKMKTDPIYKLAKACRSRTRTFLKIRNFQKKSSTFKMIGCSPQELMRHLSLKFTAGMTLENHGKWHVDHIIPLSSASNEEDVIRLCHYTNLQPLWAQDNLTKSNKITEAALAAGYGMKWRLEKSTPFERGPESIAQQ